ncbi:MAG: PSD1 and planctomycete cytochrome C domain-containing protein [Verrucomicrobiota bacterium]
MPRFFKNLSCLLIAGLPHTNSQAVDFSHEIVPILREHCAECHSGDQKKGGLSFNSRAALIEGSEYGEVVVPGNAAASYLVEVVTSNDADIQMPPKGERVPHEKVALLKKWIEADLPWQQGFSFSGKPLYEAPLKPNRPPLPDFPGHENPVDRFLHAYSIETQLQFSGPVDDRTFVRRASLDLVGLLPTPAETTAFVAERSPDKHTTLVERLLKDNKAYAEHWMTFWNDALRNAYKGTGFIDGGRTQITAWLFESLYKNKAYDVFVEELVNPPKNSGAQGFVNGIKWRGNVNESQRREMQAAQNISQVFLGTNLKCASCHDSFINDWKLADAYAMATIFSDDATGSLELHRCDQPTGATAAPGFLFPELGSITAPDRSGRQTQLANLVTHDENGRFARTIVNRLWKQLMGRGLVEPVDDMDTRPWNSNLLDWLAVDLVENGYDLKHTLRTIATSKAYRQVTQPVSKSETQSQDYQFRGPIARPLSAEQLLDAISQVTGQWPEVTEQMTKNAGRAQGAQLQAVASVLGQKSYEQPAYTRAVFTFTTPLQRALGRPNREQVVTGRPEERSTLQALELTANSALDEKINAGAAALLAAQGKKPNAKALTQTVYLRALSRPPTRAELSLALELLTNQPTKTSVAELLWAVLMLPEFQLNQ